MGANRLNLIKCLLFMIILVSCNKEKGKNFYELYLINSEKKIDKIRANYYIYFAKNMQNQICVIELYEILYPYEKNNITKSLDLYFNEILNQKTVMMVDSVDHVCFEVDKKIENDYLKLNRNDFLLKYAYESAKKERYLIDNKLVGDNNLCVAYFLFKSGFGITFDDYLGSYYVIDLVKK